MSDTRPVPCGVEIGTDTTLGADLACDQGPALVIVADGVTLDRGQGNGEFDGSDGTLMPPCGRNVWEDNDFGKTNQPCVERRAGD